MTNVDTPVVFDDIVDPFTTFRENEIPKRYVIVQDTDSEFASNGTVMYTYESSENSMYATRKVDRDFAETAITPPP